MDYEKMYKEALERAKANYKADKEMGFLENCDMLELIFPELAESDDERIRKELKEAFEAYDIESKWNGIPIRSIFAWLEKQKEQKPEWSEEEFNKTISLVYKAIRKALASLAVYAEDEALLDSKEETLSYYSQRCAEKIFESLRPSWKPSEEQMDVLNKMTLGSFLGSGQYDILRTLYEQLKKL